MITMSTGARIGAKLRMVKCQMVAPTVPRHKSGKNRAVETLDAKQIAEHLGKRAQRGRLCDVGFRPDRLGDV